MPLCKPHVMTVFITLVLVVLTITSVANSSSDQDNSWHLMCEMHHKDMFVFDASVSSFGCKLSCTVLTSTSDKHKAFFDKSVTHEHNLNDGTYCKRDHVSVHLLSKISKDIRLKRQASLMTSLLILISIGFPRFAKRATALWSFPPTRLIPIPTRKE